MKLKKENAFTLMEVMVTMLILLPIIGGLCLSLNTGKDAFVETSIHIQLRENLRRTMDKTGREVRETGYNNLGAVQFTIFDAAGANSSDIIRFSVPVVCESGTGVMDSNGDVANWGAPLTWGCTSSSCMDADDDCSTVEYRFVEYRINTGGELLRRVLDSGASLVRQDIFAVNISDFQAVTYFKEDANLNGILDAGEDLNGSGALDGRIAVMALTITATRNAGPNNQFTTTRSSNIYLRNGG